MGVIKLRKWELILVRMVALPTLERVARTMEEKAKQTPASWDDILAGAFRAVIEFLKSPEAIEET